uniref:Uncharacterized protein n=1 Tax=Arion vulgaris TaxID=1028688 RepID=A0A0B7AIQ8_9EUPU
MKYRKDVPDVHNSTSAAAESQRSHKTHIIYTIRHPSWHSLTEISTNSSS